MAEASEAALAATADMLTELVDKVPVKGEDHLRAELGLNSVEASEGASSNDVAVAQPEGEQETVLIPDFEPDVPDDILAEAEMPDFDDEAEQELVNEEEEYYSEEDNEERKKRIAAEKKVKWYEERLAQNERAKWEAEALKFWPLSEHAIKSIKATSHRGFRREAKAAHEAVLPYVKPLIEQLKAATEAAKAEAQQDGREAAKAAWGAPTVGPGNVPVRAADRNEELEAARKSGNLAKVIGVLRKQSMGGE